MLDLVEIRRRLQDRNLSAVARAIGLSPQYLHHLATGQAQNPRLIVMMALSAYLEQNP